MYKKYFILNKKNAKKLPKILLYLIFYNLFLATFCTFFLTKFLADMFYWDLFFQPHIFVGQFFFSFSLKCFCQFFWWYITSDTRYVYSSFSPNFFISLVLELLSAHVERFKVSRMQIFSKDWALDIFNCQLNVVFKSSIFSFCFLCSKGSFPL